MISWDSPINMSIANDSQNYKYNYWTVGFRPQVYWTFIVKLKTIYSCSLVRIMPDLCYNYYENYVNIVLHT